MTLASSDALRVARKNLRKFAENWSHKKHCRQRRHKLVVLECLLQACWPRRSVKNMLEEIWSKVKNPPAQNIQEKKSW